MNAAYSFFAIACLFLVHRRLLADFSMVIVVFVIVVCFATLLLSSLLLLSWAADGVAGTTAYRLPTGCVPAGNEK